jgi:hypothetical protein
MLIEDEHAELPIDNLQKQLEREGTHTRRDSLRHILKTYGYTVATKRPRSNGAGRNRMPVLKGYTLENGSPVKHNNNECVVRDDRKGSPTV